MTLYARRLFPRGRLRAAFVVSSLVSLVFRAIAGEWWGVLDWFIIAALWAEPWIGNWHREQVAR